MPLTAQDTIDSHEPREGRVHSLPLGVAGDGPRPNPLGSHLPFPMNVNAPQNELPERDYVKMRAQIQPRRATLPSLMFNQPDADARFGVRRSEDLGGTDVETHSLHESTIGIALTTKEDVTHHRRSRSMDELRKLLKEHEKIEPRRRSDELNEIKSWRLSYLDRPESVLAVAPDMQDLEQHQGHDQRFTETHAHEHVDDHHHESVHDHIHNRDHALVDGIELEHDFGNETDEPDVATIAPDASSEIEERRVGTPDFVRLVKQTRGPDSGIAASTDGLERQMPDRISNVEHRLKSLEDAFQRLNGRSNRQTIILEGADRRHRSAGRQRPHSPLPEAERPSSPESSADEGAIFSPATVLFPTPTHHSVKTGSFSDESVSLPPANIYPHLTPLYNALQYERSARKRLESELLRLQREMYELQVMVRRLEDKNGYPTPSPDTHFHPYLNNRETEQDKDVFETPQEEIAAPRLINAGHDDADIF